MNIKSLSNFMTAVRVAQKGSPDDVQTWLLAMGTDDALAVLDLAQEYGDAGTWANLWAILRTMECPDEPRNTEPAD
jgi:hypothetical protein